MYIVMIPNGWGRGKTTLEAANNARKALGKRSGKSMPVPRIVFRYDEVETPAVFVDDMGCLCWEGARPVTVEKVK